MDHRSHLTAALCSVCMASLAAAQDSQDAQVVELLVGRSTQVQLDWSLAGVSVTTPEVADVEPLTPDRLLISGKGPGSTDIILWGPDGALKTIEVRVGSDLTGLEADLAILFPGATLEVHESLDNLVVTGLLGNLDQAPQLHKFLEALETPFVDMTTLPGVQQVQVQVRVAEVSRKFFRTLGVNGFGVGDDVFIGSTLGPTPGGPINPFSIGVPGGTPAERGLPFVFNNPVNVSAGVTLFAGFPSADLELFMQALSDNQFLRVLAEPTLITLSGEEASFLAGGEFPVPVLQGGSGATSGGLTIEYKQFGVSLTFRPKVLGNGAIRMDILSELSELSDLGAVEVEGFRVPSVLTRRTDTTLQMHSGQTFAMAGLISENTSAQVSKTPVLGDLPVLGQMFRSVRYVTGETELLVLVTPSLVEPMSTSAEPPLPGAESAPPSDWELFFQGRLSAKDPAKPLPGTARWMEELGLDDLEGPGAWASHSE